MAMQTPEDYLNLADEHLKRVQIACHDPTDWAILASFGLYCVEAAVMAAAIYSGFSKTRQHGEKANYAEQLHDKHGLPNVGSLMRNLNEARKAAAYGDIEAPELVAEDLVVEIEEYVAAVRGLVRK